MASISRQMAEFARNLRFEDIPGEAVHQAKRSLLDSMGCALAAIQSPDMDAMNRFIEKLGGAPEATVIGTGVKTNAPNAALMNSLLIRAPQSQMWPDRLRNARGVSRISLSTIARRSALGSSLRPAKSMALGAGAAGRASRAGAPTPSRKE